MGKHLKFFFFTLLAIAFAVSVVPPTVARPALKDVTKIADAVDNENAAKSSSPRRNLTGGACAASNPIDKCWRCKPNWAEDRQALANCALGFGKGTTGGKGGQMYVVTVPDDDPAEPKEGSLRFGVTRNKPVWITFARDMVISLKQELVINNDKTIDGRGAKVEIANGGGLSLYHVKNVIIHGIHIHDIKVTPGGMIKNSETQKGPRAKSDGDGINVVGSSKVWVDHVTLSKGPDGLIDVTLGSTAVTVSNCKFSDHDKVMLFGADDKHSEDKGMKATIAYNKFLPGCDQRMPRCRWGLFQVVNNDYNKWGNYAVVGSANPTIICQGNRYLAPDDPTKKEVTRRDTPQGEWKKWSWRSQKELFLNGAFFVDSGSDVPPAPEMIPPEPADAVEKLTADAGALLCSPGKPC